MSRLVKRPSTKRKAARAFPATPAGVFRRQRPVTRATRQLQRQAFWQVHALRVLRRVYAGHTTPGIAVPRETFR